MWIQFWDMHSGGPCKEAPFEKIYIEAESEEQAKIIFYNKFGHNPERVSCTCCGSDYSVSSHQSLAQLTGYERGCRCLLVPRDPQTGRYLNNDPVIKFNYYLEEGEEPPNGFEVDTKSKSFKDYQLLEKYITNKDVLVLQEKDIKPEWKYGELPQQRYVYID